jgi:hypothetical protein
MRRLLRQPSTIALITVAAPIAARSAPAPAGGAGWHDHRVIRTAFETFRRGAGAAFGSCRFNARITPIRANIGGPSRSATSISAAIAACHGIVLCLRQLGDVERRVAERHQRFPAWHRDRIEKPLIPWHSGYDRNSAK